MSAAKAPCKGCVPPTRYPGCHSNCEKYKEFRAELDAYNDAIREDKQRRAELNNFRRAGIEKCKKKKF